MANQYVNKVVYYGDTLIDLTADTVTQSDVLSGKTFHDKSGATLSGNCAYTVDASSVTASVSEVLATKTFAKGSSILTGEMTNNGAVTGTISTKAQEYTIPQGYHDGSGKVSISSTEQDKIISSNILQGVTILGVTGNVSPASDIHIEPNKGVTPSTSQQIVLPTSPTYDVLAQVTVNAVPYTETDNVAGGKTVTIGS